MFLYCAGLRWHCVNIVCNGLHHYMLPPISISAPLSSLSPLTPGYHHSLSVAPVHGDIGTGASCRSRPQDESPQCSSVISNICQPKYFLRPKIFLFQILARLRVRAVRSVTVTMIVLTKMARRRDNEGRGPISPPSSSRSWRLSLLAIDIPTCQPERRFQCGPT